MITRRKSKYGLGFNEPEFETRMNKLLNIDTFKAVCKIQSTRQLQVVKKQLHKETILCRH